MKKEVNKDDLDLKTEGSQMYKERSVHWGGFFLLFFYTLTIIFATLTLVYADLRGDQFAPALFDSDLSIHGENFHLDKDVTPESYSPVVCGQKNERGNLVLCEGSALSLRDTSKGGEDIFSRVNNEEFEKNVISRMQNVIDSVTLSGQGDESTSNIKVERFAKDDESLNVSGLLPVVVSLTRNGVDFESIVYSNIDGTAFITAPVFRFDGSMYGDSFVLSSYSRGLSKSKSSLLASPASIADVDDIYTSQSKIEVSDVPSSALVDEGSVSEEKSSIAPSLQEALEKEDPGEPKAEENTFEFNGAIYTPEKFEREVLSQSGFISKFKEKTGHPVLYIFMDPWCSVCHNLFRETKDLADNGLDIRWIPIFGLTHNGFSGESSYDAALKLLAKGSYDALGDYVESNVLPESSSLADLASAKAKLDSNVKISLFIQGGAQVTPVGVWKDSRETSGKFAVRVGISRADIDSILSENAFMPQAD